MTMAILLGVAFATLGYRLVYLQIFHHEPLRREVEEKIHRTVLKMPRRGAIRDCHGNVLAGSVFVKTVYANPTLLSNRVDEVAHLLAPLLNLNETALRDRLQPRTFVNRKGQAKIDPFVVLQHKVSLESWELIQATMKSLPRGVPDSQIPQQEKAFYRGLRHSAIFTDNYESQMRVYPNKTLAAHVVGFANSVEQTNLTGVVTGISGAEGIELILNSTLTGISGWRVTDVVRNRELVTARGQNVEPRSGQDVILTIDAGLQHIVESELADAMQKFSPDSICAIVVRPRTGEILSLANLPTFDPNHAGVAPPEHRRNRAISDTYEPGSTFKVVAISGALNEGLVTLDTPFDCEGGRTYFAGKPLRDDHPSGTLTVEEIVGKSSNIGTFKIALLLNANRLDQYIRSYGFGSRSAISLAGEENGTVHPVKKWSKLSISRIPIGQGIAVTPLQMVMAMSAIANRGRLMQPMLIHRVLDEQGRTVAANQPRLVRQVISEATAQQMVTALKTVVSAHGTARKAMIDHYAIAGKTGTAQKPEKGGYLGKHVSSFVGFFPADNPELCITVVLDDPKPVYYAASTAVPVFRNIAERAAKYLAIPPSPAPAEAPAAHLAADSAAARGKP